MQIKIFDIPVGAESEQTDELNHFLRANRVVDVKKELAIIDGNSCWTFCITYMQTSRPIGNESSKSGQKTDYKEILEPEVFEKFSELRRLRKSIAEKEAIPAFAVFTDAELAELAKIDKLTLHSMSKVPGIGKKKIEKYGPVFCDEQLKIEDEENRTPERTDSES